MKLGGLRRSRNVTDQRGRRGGMSRAVSGGGLGFGAIILVVLAILFPNLREPLLSMIPQEQTSGGAGGGQSAPINDEHNDFAKAVMGSAEDVWKELLGSRYRDPKMVLFSGRASTPCGPATAASGPFYCPADKTIYIDPAFYQVMAQQLRAPGDFAQAYVIAHEFAHFVQDLQGTIEQVNRRRTAAGRGTPQANQQTVRLELQADCYSGVWARRTDQQFDVLEDGDLEEAINAADRIGDDALGMHDPEQYTHGTSAQRTAWFRKGLRARNLSSCNTFSGRYSRL